MILEAMPRRHPNNDTRRTLAILVALFALLMPALLPFGSRPVVAMGSYVVPHAHHHAADAAQPHDHGGGTESLPDAAQLLSPAVFALLVAIVLLATFATARHGVVLDAPHLAPARRFSCARPRAPPAQG